MPGLVFKKSSTSAILVRMAQENPAGVAAGQGAGAAAADGNWLTPGTAAERAAWRLARSAGIRASGCTRTAR